jgi:hypothetical protein
LAVVAPAVITETRRMFILVLREKQKTQVIATKSKIKTKNIFVWRSITTDQTIARGLETQKKEVFV